MNAAPKLDQHNVMDSVPLLLEARGQAEHAETATSSEQSTSKAESHREHNLQRETCSLHRRFWNSGPACMIAATVTFAFSTFWVKLVPKRVTVFEIVFVRSLLSLIVTCIVKWGMKTRPFLGHRRNYWKLTSRGVFGATAMTLCYVVIQMLPLGDAVAVFFTNAAATSVVAYLFGYEQPSWFIVGGCATSIGGLLLIAQPPLIFGGAAWSMTRVLGVILGMAAALFAAGAFVSLRAIGDDEESIVTSLWFHAIAMLSTIIPLSLSMPAPAVWPSLLEGRLLLGIAATSFWGQLLLARGFQLLAASSAAAINLLQVVHAHILGAIFLDDDLEWPGVVGAFLIGAGAVLVHQKTQVPPAVKTLEMVDKRHLEAADISVDSDLDMSSASGSSDEGTHISALPSESLNV